jgi:hypothetical protein
MQRRRSFNALKRAGVFTSLGQQEGELVTKQPYADFKLLLVAGIKRRRDRGSDKVLSQIKHPNILHNIQVRAQRLQMRARVHVTLKSSRGWS